MELSKIVRHIRTSAGLSQEKFADEVGVTRLTVTRWESGASIPNKIAQIKIYDVAEEHDVEFFDLIISDMPEHKPENNKMILYHASRIGIAGPIGPKSRRECDFGMGFYMGVQASQPLTLIFGSKKNIAENAVVYTVEFDLKGLNVLYIPVGIDWALLVAYSRGEMEEYVGSPLYEKYSKMLIGYDVAVGKIADDKLFAALERFFEGSMSEEGMIECLSVMPLGEQYVALTEKACRQIRILEERRFSELERLCIYDKSAENRNYGVEMANSVFVKYRRNGRYFDKILKKGE
ncbi:MAG: DUF3990 domain-containing protein [Methanomassiliicoccaceae archaeon]|jgi:transcriptional regulator with XRE-family HTH domain|nr:DUF3990 domain-containing protein [Methanomassiliicoccaceae archaeon]